MSETNASNGKLFFFFGSLRTGYWNQRILSSKATLLGLARTVLPFALYISERGTVPTTVPNEGSTPLIGEVYALDDDDAARVFRLETGYDSGEFQVEFADGSGTAQVTIFHHKSAKACGYISGKPLLIESGDYTLAITPQGERITLTAPVILEGSPAGLNTGTEATA